MNAKTVQALAKWFKASARTLPWRGPIGAARDPYAVLVSESMLQQTQVSRIVERFPRFMTRFPTVHALAAADEREVLAMWAGLGYYRRARSLHAAAKMIAEQFDGNVPSDIESLLKLPGVGRYTAGAIASLAFGEPAPIVDGNVARVLLRVNGREVRADDRSTQPWLWQQAQSLASAGSTLQPMGAALANEAIMELGATICLPSPAAPRCAECPLTRTCIARHDGTHDRIPLPKTAAARKTVYCAAVVISDARGRIVLEQRGDARMWAGLWQSPTIERDDSPPTRAELARAVGLKAAMLTPRGSFTHITTHRHVEFAIFAAASRSRIRPTRGEWVEPKRLATFGMSNAQQRVLKCCDALRLPGLSPAGRTIG